MPSSNSKSTAGPQASPTSEPVTLRSSKTVIFAALERALEKPKHRPMERMELAKLMLCESGADLADWVTGYACAKAMKGDPHAGELLAAMKVYREAQRGLFTPSEGSGP